MRTANQTKQIGFLALAAFAGIATVTLPRVALASWGFTATLFAHGNCPGAPIIPPIPITNAFPNDSVCESLRSSILAITETVPESGGTSCNIGYTCTPCSGTDDAVFGGAAFSPLQNGVGAINPLGSVAGQPAWSPSSSEASPIWQSETAVRVQAYPSLNTGVMPTSSIRYQNRFAWNLGNLCRGNSCTPHGNGYGGSSIRTQGPTYSQPDEPQRMSDDPSVTGDTLPMIGADMQGQPISGPGVHQGPADTPPPPTPITTNRNELCPKKWYRNSATQKCYGGGYNDCNGDGSAGSHTCRQEQ